MSPATSVDFSSMRIAGFYFFLLAGQGFLSALFGTLPAPDLFLIAALSLLGRTAPWTFVLSAYGIGLVQDLVGFGVFGMHAIALAGAALTANVVRMQFAGFGLLERLLIVVAAQTAKWGVTIVLLNWLASSPEDPVTLVAVALSETVLTIAAALLLLPWAEALLDRRRGPRRETLT